MSSPLLNPERRRFFEHTPGIDPGWLRVFLPLKNEDFLVHDEEVLYDRRFHSAILLQPAFELIAALTLVVWIQLDIGLTRSTIAVIMVLSSIWILGRLILKVHRSTRRSLVIFGAMIALAVALRRDRELLALLIVGGFGIRFFGRWLRWAFYRRLLITNRRVIEVDGLVGSSVATMPLFRVTDALLARSPAAEILGYALFRIESAGQDQALGRINFLDEADRFHELLIQLSTTAKKDEIVLGGPGDLGSELDRMM